MDKDGEIFHRTPGCASDPIHAIIFAPSHVGHAYGWSVQDLFFGGANLFSGKQGQLLTVLDFFPSVSCAREGRSSSPDGSF